MKGRDITYGPASLGLTDADAAAAQRAERDDQANAQYREVFFPDGSLRAQPEAALAEQQATKELLKRGILTTTADGLGAAAVGGALPLAVGGAFLYGLGREFRDLTVGPPRESQGELVFGLGQGSGADSGFVLPFTEQVNQEFRAYQATGGTGSIYDFASSPQLRLGDFALSALQSTGLFGPYSSPGFSVTGIGNTAIPGYTGLITEAFVPFYQQSIAEGYTLAQAELKGGTLDIGGVSERTALGQRADALARASVNRALAPGGQLEAYKDQVLVNRYLPDPSGSGAYRIPDIQIPSEGVIIDGTIGYKDINTPQVSDFFRFSPPTGTVIIVPPTQPPIYIPRPVGR